jgi:hypothetical protein
MPAMSDTLTRRSMRRWHGKWLLIGLVYAALVFFADYLP